MSSNLPHLALVGFGEAAQAFRKGWGALAPDDTRAYDIKTGPEMQARYAASGVQGAATLAEALAGAGRVFCLVTADQALAAAEAAAPHLAPGAFWFDGNSCAPETKRLAAQVIQAAGGRYVDVAVMAPVHPKLHRVPLLISGPHAEAALAPLAELDMQAVRVEGPLGAASAIKMLRSVMIKGFEALTSECLLAARRAGVEDQVLASLQASDPWLDWAARGAYNLERMMVHGKRRAAEMREVVATVEALGLPAPMARATVEWQAQVGALGLEGGAAELVTRADLVLKHL